MTDPTGRPADAEPVTPDPVTADPGPDPEADQAGPDASAGDVPGPAAEGEPVEPTAPAGPVETPPAVVPAEASPAPADTAVAAEAVPEPTPVPTEPAAVPPEGGDADTSSESTSDTRRRRLLAACAVLFAVSVALAVLAAVLASRLEGERDRRDAVEQVSGRFATALLTYNHENLDEAKERVLALSTGKFRREYEQAFANGLDTLIRETRATSAGTVTDIFVGEVDADTASVIVVANAVSEGTTGTRRTVASYIQLELVRVSGQWRVDGVTNLNFGQGTTPTSTPE